MVYVRQTDITVKLQHVCTFVCTIRHSIVFTIFFCSLQIFTCAANAFVAHMFAYQTIFGQHRHQIELKRSSCSLSFTLLGNAYCLKSVEKCLAQVVNARNNNYKICLVLLVILLYFSSVHSHLLRLHTMNPDEKICNCRAFIFRCTIHCAQVKVIFLKHVDCAQYASAEVEFIDSLNACCMH